MLEWYKPQQGQRFRGLIGVLMGVLSLHGCVRLHTHLTSDIFRGAIPGLDKVFGDEFVVEWRMVVATTVAAALALLIYRFSNWPKAADFLIDTESELKKVAWAPRNEVIGNSIVVCITVIILAVFIFVVDWGLLKIRGYNWDDIWRQLLA